VYTDIRRMTVPLGIPDRSTIWLFLVDRAGRVRWRGSGGQDAATAAALTVALAELPGHPRPHWQRAWGRAVRDGLRLPFPAAVAALGVTPATAHVTLTPDRLVACFGPWECHTAPSNVRAVSLTGPYHWYRAIGPRLSLADHGLTFGTTTTTTTTGVCLQLRDPAPGIGPTGLIRHPSLTLTVADPQRFAAAVRRCADLAPGHAAPAQDGE
jgi:hypothetical protein